MIELTIARKQDYLDGDCRGPYKLVVNIAFWRFHFIFGVTQW